MKKTLSFAATILLFAISTATTQAQCFDDPRHPCYESGCDPACLSDPNGYDPFNVPFDGGASLIALGGVALGIFGSKKKKK